MNHYKSEEECYCESHRCQDNWRHFVFYHNLEFYLISTRTCYKQSLDTKEAIVNSIIKKSKPNNLSKAYAYNYGRMDLDVSFKEERLRSLNLQRVIYEVNMIYDMPARKDKVIATPVRYIDLAINSEIVTANYEETKKYLEENGYSDLLTGTNSLHMLYRYNSIWGGANKDIQSTRSIESLTKKIRNEINRSSKHKSVV